jgi:hypothetical protein
MGYLSLSEFIKRVVWGGGEGERYEYILERKGKEDCTYIRLQKVQNCAGRPHRIDTSMAYWRIHEKKQRKGNLYNEENSFLFIYFVVQPGVLHLMDVTKIQSITCDTNQA